MFFYFVKHQLTHLLLQGSNTFLSSIPKDFLRTFKDQFSQIQGPKIVFDRDRDQG